VDLAPLRQAAVDTRLVEIQTRNARLFDEEVLKLDRWSEDLKLSLEHELKELDKQIRELRRAGALAQSLEDKLAHQKRLRELERQRNGRRRELFEAQDGIDQQREELITTIEQALAQQTSVGQFVSCRWTVC
jgi:adenine-specific DNA-methyltransferase